MLSKHAITAKKAFDTIAKGSTYVVCARKKSVWTPEKTIKSPYKDVEIPNCTLPEYVWQNLEKWPQRTASVCADTGRGYTYEQAFKLSNTFGANLRKKFNIRDGDVVAVLLRNMPDYPLVTLGIMEAGGIVTTLNPVYTAHEIQRQLVMSNSKVIVTMPESVTTVRDALKMAKLDLPIIVIKTNDQKIPDGVVLFNDLSQDVHVDKSCLKEVRRSLKDICFLPYSSGTTGLPKGVELTHKNLIVNCEQINEEDIKSHECTTASHQDVTLAILPYFHIYGATVLSFHKMSLGVKLVSLPKYQPELLIQALDKYKMHVLVLAPPLALMLASHEGVTPKTLKHVRCVINGAAPLAAADIERFMKRAGHFIDFRQGYGLTETSPTVCIAPVGCTDYHSVGYPIPNTEIKIVDANLNNLGPNETGEILIRGPQVMTGYKDNPKANSETFTSDGWFRSGDLGIIDDKNMLTIADRVKELIKVKGFQVPPAELEGILREHPAVLDAAVIGISHPTNGEAPKAFVVLKKDKKPDSKEICDFVNEKVAPFKRIKDIMFIDCIPKSAAGKILRRVLKDEYS